MASIAHDHAPARPRQGSDFLSAIADAVTRRVLYVSTRNELAGLNDRELADIGLNRADIARVSREAAGLR